MVEGGDPVLFGNLEAFRRLTRADVPRMRQRLVSAMATAQTGDTGTPVDDQQVAAGRWWTEAADIVAP